MTMGEDKVLREMRPIRKGWKQFRHSREEKRCSMNCKSTVSCITCRVLAGAGVSKGTEG
jgi:hypothetical protein